jgi:hypothetical protein
LKWHFFKNKAQTYLLIQGHTLYNKVIKLILAEIKKEIKTTTFETLADSEKSEFEKHLKNFTDLSRNYSEKAANITQVLSNIDF